MSRYTFPVTLSSAKKNGPNTRLLEMAQNTFTLGLSLSISIRVWGFWDPHIRVLCLLTFPDKKVASSLKTTRSDKPWSVSILLSKSSQNDSRLDGSSVWSFCTNCSLYGYNCSRFRRIFLTVVSGIFSSRLALRTDFLGLRMKVSRTLSTVSSVKLGLPTRPFPWWQMYPLWQNCSYHLRIDISEGPRRPNCRRNVRWTATNLLSKK